MSTLTRTIGALTVALTLTGCASVSEPVVQFFNDSSTTSEIKTRLAREKFGTLTSVGVTTTDDMVRLTGIVADDAERRRVEAIARGVAGDNRVVSELRVADSPSAAPRAQK